MCTGPYGEPSKDNGIRLLGRPRARETVKEDAFSIDHSFLRAGLWPIAGHTQSPFLRDL